MEELRVKAYAKINLGLRILRKREDNFHEIETVLHLVHPYDEIILQRSSSITLTCDTSILNVDENNLCLRAAKLLQEYSGTTAGVKITLIKKIPIGAGLGGGSSDAAATLVGLTKLWNLKLNNEQLNQLAIKIGSDVPYFLNKGTAYATGRGEILEYFKLDIPHWIVIAYPNVNISTEWAYKEFHKSKYKSHFQHSGSTLKRIIIENINEPQQLNHVLYNDFEPLILHNYKPIAHLKILLYSLGAKFAQMSGSGSAVYGFFVDEQLAKEAAERLMKNYKVFITPPYFDP